MTTPLSANETLEREFLTVRAKLLEIAAAIDRLERASGSITDDPRLKQIAAAIDLLQQPLDGNALSDRATAIQMVFSLPYEPAWREKFEMAASRRDETEC